MGAMPGLTRSISAFPVRTGRFRNIEFELFVQISHDPLIHVLDTPGIMPPRFERDAASLDTAFKLAITGWSKYRTLEIDESLEASYCIVKLLFSSTTTSLVCSGAIKDDLVGEEPMAAYLFNALVYRRRVGHALRVLRLQRSILDAPVAGEAAGSRVPAHVQFERLLDALATQFRPSPATSSRCGIDRVLIPRA